MKNLTKFFSICFVFFYSLSIQAQTTTFGVRAGVNIATVNVDADGLDVFS